MALKELEARYATKRAKDYKLADGDGLYLLGRPNGSKLWRFKYRFDGKEKLLSLGRYPELSLAEARLRRAEAKVALGKGTDPGARETAAPVMTFEEAARAWHKNRLEALDAGHASRLLTGSSVMPFRRSGAGTCVLSPSGTCSPWCARLRRGERSTSADASSSMSARSIALPFRRAGPIRILPPISATSSSQSRGRVIWRG